MIANFMFLSCLGVFESDLLYEIEWGTRAGGWSGEGQINCCWRFHILGERIWENHNKKS